MISRDSAVRAVANANVAEKVSGGLVPAKATIATVPELVAYLQDLERMPFEHVRFLMDVVRMTESLAYAVIKKRVELVTKSIVGDSVEP